MPREMGKNLHRQEPQLTLKNHNPGCMWGILHHFQHNRWHNVVKRLPRKRLTGSGKHSSDQERIISTSDGASVQENTESAGENRVVETKAVVPPNPAHKSSMKSRLKALITDEMYRKKARHRRSSTYPLRKSSGDKAIPTQNQVKSSTSELPTENQSNHSAQDPAVPSPSEHPSSPTNTNQENSSAPCEMCDTMHKVKYLKQNEASQIGKAAMRDHTVLHRNSIYAVEPSECDSVQESKLFMDALDLLNVRQEVFLKILQDPSSSLAQQLHYRKASNTRIGLTKSISFPVKRDSKTDEGENSNTPQLEPLPPSEDILKKKNDNKLGLRRFKNIREKIKHVIRDKKKEKDRIIKDALHDKIPCDRSIGKYECQRFEKSQKKPFKRTSSFNDSFKDSVDRYNQLLEITVSREGKDQGSDKLRTKTDHTQTPIRKSHPSLSRILSLPDLRSYSSVPSDDPASNGARITPDTVAVNDQETVNLESKLEHGGDQDDLQDVGEVFDDLIDLRTAESFSSRFDLNRGPELCFSPQTPKLDDCRYEEGGIDHESLLEDSKFEGLLFFPSEEDSICIQKDYTSFDPHTTQATRGEESQLIHQFYNDLLQVQVDTKNEAEFSYVKEILELSGFTRDEILGQWHSAEHPLDPSMFEELEGGCSAECEETYAINNDHLLLFDVINEVLLGIYERSICYWPRTLSSPARIHQLPKGNRVLEEVWAEIRWLLSWRPEAIDDAVSRDLGRYDGWMNLQTEAECVGLELEDLMFDDLLDEIVAE